MRIMFVLLAAGLSSGAAGNGSEWTAEKIAKGVKARQKLIKSYSLDIPIIAKMPSQFPGKTLEYGTATTFKIDDRTGRFYCRTIGRNWGYWGRGLLGLTQNASQCARAVRHGCFPGK